MEIQDLRNEPLYWKVYTLLRDWILTGRLPPGQRLRETSLAAELKVSRTPVRDALRRLEQDRLIVPLSGNAYAVYCPTREDVDHLYATRAILEGNAARLAAARRPVAELSAMAAIVEAMEAAYDRQDVSALIDLDTRFHELLVAAAGNPVLAELHAHLALRLRHMRSLSRNVPLRRQRVLDQHRSILAAVRAGDGEEAERVTREHVLGAAAAVRARFDAHGPLTTDHQEEE